MALIPVVPIASWRKIAISLIDWGLANKRRKLGANACLQQLVAANKGVVIAKPKQVMAKQEALVPAAWIVVLADDKGEFEQILEDVLTL